MDVCEVTPVCEFCVGIALDGEQTVYCFPNHPGKGGGKAAGRK